MAEAAAREATISVSVPVNKRSYSTCFCSNSPEACMRKSEKSRHACTTLLLKRQVLSLHSSYSVSDLTAIDIAAMMHVSSLLSAKAQAHACYQPKPAKTGWQACKTAFKFKPISSLASSPSHSLNRFSNGCTAHKTRWNTRTVTHAAQQSAGEVRHTCMWQLCRGLYSLHDDVAPPCRHPLPCSQT